jgi:hypothetical protein
MSGDGVQAAYPLFHEEGRGSIPTSPLQFEFEEIQLRLAQELNAKWHSMLPRTDLGNLMAGSTSVAFGALHGGNWFAVSIWTQPIIAAMCDGHTIELRRFAICKEAPKNTASRMLSHDRRAIKKKWPFLNRAISYLAIDVHHGTIYKASGWHPVGKVCEARPQRFTRQTKQRSTGPLQTKSRKQRWQINL